MRAHRDTGRRRWPILAALLMLGGAGLLRAEMPVDEEAIRAEMEALRSELGEVPERKVRRAGELEARAVAAHDRGDLERARRLHLEAIELVPVAPLLRYELAFTLSAMGRPLDALEQAIRGLALDPDHEELLLLEATLLDDLGHPEESLRAYDELLTRHPDSFLGHLNVGITLTRLERWEEADGALRRAAELRPAHPSPLFHRARLARLQGRHDEEAELLARFLEVAPDDPRAASVAERLAELEGPAGNGEDAVIVVPPPFGDDLLGENLPAAVMAAAEASGLAYAVDATASESEVASFGRHQARRFRKRLELPAVDVVDCDEARREIDSVQQAYAWRGIERRVARCYLPDEEPWETLRRELTRIARSMLDLAPRIPVVLDRKGDRVAVEVLEGARLEWVSYALAKAVWTHEQAFRTAHGGPRDDRPSVDEEVLAFRALAQAVANTKAAALEEGEGWEPDPDLDNLLTITANGHLRGYVLFEVIHKRYGVPLDRLSDSDATALARYLDTWVFESLVEPAPETDEENARGGAATGPL